MCRPVAPRMYVSFLPLLGVRISGGYARLLGAMLVECLYVFCILSRVLGVSEVWMMVWDNGACSLLLCCALQWLPEARLRSANDAPPPGVHYSIDCVDEAPSSRLRTGNPDPWSSADDLSQSSTRRCAINCG